MNLQYYVNWTKNTAAKLDNKTETIEGGELDNLHMILGMVTEVGELADIIKKNLAYSSEIDWVNVKEELGDIMFYIASFCRINDIDLEEVITTNVDKLEARYPNNFQEDRAKVRNLKKEREILERKR